MLGFYGDGCGGQDLGGGAPRLGAVAQLVQGP